MAWCLVSPSSRGIGLALTRRLLQTTPPTLPIVATARTNLEQTRSQILDSLPEDTKAPSRLDVQKVDFDDESSIADLTGYCKDRYGGQTNSNANGQQPPNHLRLAFLIPGMLHPEKNPAQISYDAALATLKMNLLAPMLLIKHFTPFLPRKSIRLDPVTGLPDAAVMALMGARVGSITDNERGGWFSYRSSKAGVAQLVKSLDLFLKMNCAGNAMSVGLHPGTVKTELSREFWGSTPENKLFSPEFSAERLVDVVNGLEVDGGRGRVWDWKGEVVPP